MFPAPNTAQAPVQPQSFSPFASLNSAQINTQDGPPFIPDGTGSFTYKLKKVTFNPAGTGVANLTFDLEVLDTGDFVANNPAKAQIIRPGTLVRYYQGFDQPVKQAPYINAFLFATMGYSASDAAAKAQITPFFEAVMMAAVTNTTQQAHGQTIDPSVILEKNGRCNVRPGKHRTPKGDVIPFLTWSPA